MMMFSYRLVLGLGLELRGRAVDPCPDFFGNR
jgi:hypothetical protein